jgi:branched-chain amino acid transport system permease protein
MSTINAIVQGVLVGGLYALYATGLSIAFGVMRLVNLAHGDLAVAAGFVASTVALATGWSPFVAIVVVVPLGAAVGWIAQKVIFDRLVGVDPALQIVATFGLSIAISNLLLQRYSANPRSLDIGSFATSSVSVIGDDVVVGWFPLTRFLIAVAVLGALSLFVRRTRLGRAFRATSDDPATAQLMGINNRTVYGAAMAIAFGTVALAGIFNGAQTQFSPADGPLLLIYAFEAVIIGGLGSLWGTLAGGVVLGVSQALGAEHVGVEWTQAVGHIVFLLVLVFRPTGLFGKADG